MSAGEGFEHSDRQRIVASLCRLIPEFDRRWSDRYEWLNEETGLCGIFTQAANLFGSRLQVLSDDQRAGLLDFIESCLGSSNQRLVDAAATCFLENLVNVYGEDPKAALFVPMLGPKSREYCRAWDEFTGVSTRGLS